MCGSFTGSFSRLFGQAPARLAGDQRTAFRQRIQAHTDHGPGVDTKRIDLHQLLAAGVAITDRCQDFFVELVHVAISLAL